MAAEHKSLTERVEEALETMRPYLNSDGGDVRLHDIREDFIVELELLGNCGSCSMSNMTMKAGLEEAIKRTAPEVRGVMAINP
ncbi:MAG TPA: NifU family protein [Bacteroidetes bacterium]|nr:NifU family protein [Bacteroidota bacterium]